MPEHVDCRGTGVEPVQSSSAGSGNQLNVLVLQFSIGGRCGGGNDGRADDQGHATGGNADDAERLQLAGTHLGDVMHRVDAVNRERIASHNAGRVGHGDGLVAVVHVDLAADRGRGGLRHVLGLSARGVDRGYSTSSHGNAVCIVELVGVEARDHPDLIALVSEVRFRVAE